MTRAKIQMALIENESARRTSLKKRNIDLIKKMHELSTLCGVQCCVIIHSPDCPKPDLWPSRLETENVIQRYRGMPDFEKYKKMEDLESFANQQLAKAQENLKKAQKENRFKELEIIMSHNMSKNQAWMESLDDDYLSYMNNHVLKPRLEEAERRIAMFNQQPSATALEQCEDMETIVIP